MPKILDRCVRRVSKNKNIDNPYGVCTKQLQSKGILKKGTRQLTEKGKIENKKLK